MALQEQQDYINSLYEGLTHSSTSKSLSLLEIEHLKDWEEHFQDRVGLEIDKDNKL